MKLLSIINTYATLGFNRYEVEIETYKTIKRVIIRRSGWACWCEPVTLRGKDYKLNVFDYLRKHVAEIDPCYMVGNYNK